MTTTGPTAARPALATSPAFWIAALSAALHAMTLGRYGIFRDELYYVACGRRLAWGYVDHPPGVALFARLAESLFGTAPQGLRILPVLAGSLAIYLTGRLARKLAGDSPNARFAEALASLAALVAPVYLFVFHVLSMNVLDVLFWTLALSLVVAILDGGSPRLWLAFGLVAGLGLLTKLSMLFLGAGVAIGLLLTPARRHLRSPWPWAGGGLAIGLLLPYLLWQRANGWPTREFVANATAHKNVHFSALGFLGEQVGQMHPLTLPLWLGGLAWLFLARGGRYRPLAIAYVAIFALLVAQGGKPYYLAPIYPLLFAAGAAAFAGWLAARTRAWPKPVALGLLALGGAAIAPMTLPILPLETFVRYQAALGQSPGSSERHALGRLPQHYADMQGWNDLAATVGYAWSRIPATERGGCAIFAQNYGEAGAIEVLGDRYGLPDALSGHNNYFLWGPRGADGRCVIVLGDDEPRLRELFTDVRLAARFDCRDCMPYESTLPIHLCRGLKTPLAALWPTLKHYD